ncbi:MAG: FAD-dependent monooxygenase [Candidatus Eremiobacteraeota bacterium]|nr:FAD-dependent monooxygenase [Candidatus Eremiobacteraeota bacterium]
MEPHVPVIVAGAGPVGLSLALGLARFGIRSVVYEKEASLPPHSRAGIVWPRTLEIFHGWGVRDVIADRGLLAPSITITDADSGRGLVTIDFWKLLGGETLEAAPVTIGQDETEAILYDVLMTTRMSEVHFRHEVLGLTHDPDGVTARIRDADGIEREVRGSYLVGADGAHGNVRGALGMTLEGQTYDIRIMLADVRLDDARANQDFPRFSLGEQISIALRVGKSRWRLIVALPKGRSDEAALDPAFIRACGERLLGPGPFEQEWVSIFNIHRRRARTFAVGRVALAGDAAHLNSPAGGQGMNAGIADAHNLAWKLAATFAGADPAILLASYDEERSAAFSEGVEPLTDRLTRLMITSPQLLRQTVARVAPLLARLPGMRHRAARMAGMLDVHYRHSPILFGHGAVLGERAPDPALACGGVQATLVVHKLPRNVADAASTVLKVRIKRLERREAKRWGMGRRPFAALVRPDGIVGWIAPNPQPDEIEAQVRAALGYKVQSV